MGTRIFIEDLKVKASVGVYASEKKKKQPLLISFDGVLDESCRGHITDNVEDTVSYEVFLRESEALAQQKHFDLIEYFADQLAQNILKQTKLSQITIKITKPEIFKKQSAAVGVQITRSRNKA